MNSIMFSVCMTAFLFTSGALADILRYCPSNADSLCFAVAIPESASSNSGDLYFQIRAPTTYNWVALGTGDEMRGANMFIMYQDGRGKVTISGRHGTGHDQPPYDSSVQLTLLEGSGVSNGIMTANVACANCQSWQGGGSMSLESKKASWISAWALVRPMSSALETSDVEANFGMHDGDAIFDLDLTKATVDGSSSNPFFPDTTGEDTTSPSGVTVVETDTGGGSAITHGFVMILAFVVLYPLGVFTFHSRWKWLGRVKVLAPRSTRPWLTMNPLRAHVVIQVVALVLTIGAMILGLKLQSSYDLSHNPHTVLGLLVPILLGLQPVFGMIHHKKYKAMSEANRRRTWWGRLHQAYGWLLMLGGIVTGGLGLWLALASTWAIVVYIVIAVLCNLGALVFAIWSRTHSDGDSCKRANSMSTELT